LRFAMSTSFGIDVGGHECLLALTAHTGDLRCDLEIYRVA
jgi:hypothetical protein